MTPVLLIATVLLAIICGALTFRRLDTLFTERTKGIVVSGMCLTMAFVLLIPPVYEVAERLLPVPNATDMISKFFALVAVAFLGGAINRIFPSDYARRWVSGAQGAIALAVAATSVFACFVFTDAPYSSPQLMAYTSQASVKIQTWLMLLYVAYVIVPFVVPAFRDSRNNPLQMGRIASFLLAVGFLVSCLRLVMYPIELLFPNLAATFQLISNASSLFVVLGLGTWRYVRIKNIADKKLGSSILSID